MNIELYIQSGIVESYALGLATPFEAAELEQLLPHYPELKEALSEVEYHLELFCIDNEVPPPPDLREKVRARLRETPSLRDEVREKGDEGRSKKKGEYISVEVSSPYIRVHRHWKTFFIIVFILSKILLASAIYFFLEYRHTQRHVLQLEEQLGKKEAGVGEK